MIGISAVAIVTKPLERYQASSLRNKLEARDERGVWFGIPGVVWCPDGPLVGFGAAVAADPA